MVGSEEPIASSEKARLALQGAVGKRVRAIRTERRLGQAECARAAGIDKGTLFRLEKGQLNVTVQVLARIALALQVDLPDVLAGVQVDPSLLEE